MAREIIGTNPVLVDRLYKEAINLADEARTYFAVHSKVDRKRLNPMERVMYTCESLRISTRLMHVISWLMVRKAVANGELTEAEGARPERQLGDLELCRNSSATELKRLPPAVVSLTLRSQSLFQRAYRLQETGSRMTQGRAGSSNPVAAMLEDLETAY